MKQTTIYGTRAIIEAIKAGRHIERILIQKDARTPLLTELRKLIKTHRIAASNVPGYKLNKWKDKNHQGTIAFLSLIEPQELERIIPLIYEEGKTPLLLMLDGVTDVRNFGAICRSAECFGADAVIIPLKGSAKINEEAVKASAGAIHHINICKEADLNKTIRFMKDSGLRLIGITEKSKQTIQDVDFSGPCCLVMGSEDTGISSKVLDQCDDTGKMQMSGEIASLNVSVASGIALYEVTRQRSLGA